MVSNYIFPLTFSDIAWLSSLHGMFYVKAYLIDLDFIGISIDMLFHTQKNYMYQEKNSPPL